MKRSHDNGPTLKWSHDNAPKCRWSPWNGPHDEMIHGPGMVTGPSQNWIPLYKKTFEFVAGLRLDHYRDVTCVGMLVNTIAFVLILISHSMLMRTVRKHRANANHQRVLSQIDRSVNKMTFRIVLAILLLYPPYIIMSAVRLFLPTLKESRTFGMAWFLACFWSYSNNFVNPLIFMSVSLACRKKIFSMFLNRVENDVVHRREVDISIHRRVRKWRQWTVLDDTVITQEVSINV